MVRSTDKAPLTTIKTHQIKLRKKNDPNPKKKLGN